MFTSAYKFPIKSLKKNAITITMLGTIGLMATIAIFGLVIYFTAPAFVELSLVAAFLIASILAPTDPVSVTAILEKTSDDPNVSTIVEGESMINDGTSIVIFTIISAMFVSGETFSIGSFAGEFLLVSAGGIVLGITGRMAGQQSGALDA
ncbi:cation:proton antiporter [Sinobaca sp. H24]|uniref:cation:proton antiporter domain-containing protein n=1 Tax=Sinobaca sp. H24 TaxID=2923376 RepID=UPI0027E2DAFC|nr:cation:proton antiporter [Sinobaca sp. H24]